MDLGLIDGLPAHVLLVHVVVVLVPLAALAVITVACAPRIGRRLGLAVPVLALVALASVPLTTEAGEWLERHVDPDPFVRRHTAIADGLLPWVLALFVLATAVWWVQRRAASEPSAAGWVSAVPVRVAAVLLSLAVGVGAGVQVYRIGDSGARAAWHDGYSAGAVPRSEG
ncbi:DUF2231 domain-containing protein [Streptomyces sp. NPDC089919]|uniref:DUF2231 domain-containing protein n=1 Tax=Streptomyces sp. NPDC089919 TaxID=3155188 RepID=UPI00342D9A8D